VSARGIDEPLQAESAAQTGVDRTENAESRSAEEASEGDARDENRSACVFVPPRLEILRDSPIFAL
jgi:hypothetical protein